MEVLAVIPARSGSKRIKDKNIRPFVGKPIIEYVIETLLKSEIFSSVIVSTDSEKIANIASQAGAEIPFMRTSDTADDYTPMSEVALDTMLKMIELGRKPKYVCLAMATAPFLKSRYLKEAWNLIRTKHISAVVSITPFNFPIQRSVELTEDGFVNMVWPENTFVRSQDLKPRFHDAAQFYFLDTDRYLKNPTLWPKDALPIMIPKHLVQDIDTEEDWMRAELMYMTLRQAEFLNQESL